MSYSDGNYVSSFTGGGSGRVSPPAVTASVGNPVTSRGMEIREEDEVKLLAHTRASEETRQRFILHLTDCHSQGFLPDDEFERRRELARKADTVKFLGQLVHDLPAMPDPETAAEVAAKKAAAEAEKNSFAYRWKNDHGFHNILCLAGIVLGLAVAATPVTVLSVMHVPRGLTLGVGLPCLAAGVVLLISSIVELCVRIDGL